MSKPRSPALILALQMVQDGATVYAAAKLTGLDQSTISRTIKPPIKHTCPSCGRTIKNPLG